MLLNAPTLPTPMHDPVAANTHSASAHAAGIGGIGNLMPAIESDGRISMPGFSHGLTIATYLPLVHLYTRILEASRILDRYRTRLRHGESGNVVSQDQSPLTPLTPSNLLPHLYYKREDQTVTRAYKVRGAVVAMSRAMEQRQTDRFIAVSTGNHALGILKAAELLRPSSVRIVAPVNTAPWKLEKLHKAMAHLNEQGLTGEVVMKGNTFDEARNWVLDQQDANTGETYIDPYNDPWVVAGQGTLGLELLSQLKLLLEKSSYKTVSLISPIGGGGLLTGTTAALKLSGAWDPQVSNVTLQVIGLRLQDMDALLGDAIRVKEIAPNNVSLLQAMNVDIRHMSNDEMEQGVRFVKNDLQDQVEGASGGAVSPAFLDPRLAPGSTHMVVSILSGGNI